MRLVNYGIQNEESDFRAHVSVATKAVYFFPTEAGIDAIISNRDQDGQYMYRSATAKQNGMVTANGFLVPPDDIDGCIQIPIPDDLFVTANFGTNPKYLTTSERGQKAVFVVKEMLRRGLIPLPMIVEEITNKNIQIKGKDVISTLDADIQIKCDWRAGPRHLGGTGNLYLQVQERNPDGMY
jgi:hypothetical protein